MAVEAGGIGARLRAGREKLGLTVLQVAERIHTDPKIVDAIEAENYEALGAPVYARGHIRHYAELVGESAAELIALYSDLSKVAQPDLTRIVKAPSGSASNKLVAPALLVLAVFAVAGAVWWVSALSKKKPQLSQMHVVGDEAPAAAPESAPGATAMQAQPAPSGAANATQGRSAGTPAPGGTAAPGGAGASGAMAMQGRPGTTVPQGAAPAPGRTGGVANSGRAQGGAPASAAQPGRSSASTSAAVQGRTGATPSTAATQARSGSAATPSSSSGSPSSSATASTAPPLRSRNQAQVTLHYSADSWTEVYDASGARLFYDVGAANSVQTVVGTPPLRVVLGNASGVAVEFNGRHTPVAKLALPDGSVQFSINRSGRVVRAKPVADGG
jgi:cytoskeleton protein RodZ